MKTVQWQINTLLFIAIAFVIPIAPSYGQEDRGDAARYWPQWRGPLGTGIAPHANPPVHWNEQKNVRWKIPVPGNGHSTPVVWGDRVFVTAAVSYGDELDPIYNNAPGAHDNLPVTHRHHFVVLAVNRRNGEVIWQQTVGERLPHEGGHFSGSQASGSPVTDGKHLITFFGSGGLYCLDLDGQVVWEKNLGEMQTKHAHGEGASPALYGDWVIVNWDHEGQSFVIVLDKRSGRQIWQAARQEVTSWATPIVVERGDQRQVIISGTKRVRGYDLANGQVVWECGGLSQNIVASPVSADGIVYAASSYDTRAMLAIRLDGAKGDLTDTDQIIWRRTRGTPYVPSLLLYDQSLYFLAHYQGILTRVHAPTGDQPHRPFRLSGVRDIYASPVGAAGRIYVTDRQGMTLVISHTEIPRVMARNRLDDRFSASIAMVGNELYLRGQQFLYCIAVD